jgi:hypothetical protein
MTKLKVLLAPKHGHQQMLLPNPRPQKNIEIVEKIKDGIYVFVIGSRALPRCTLI